MNEVDDEVGTAKYIQKAVKTMQNWRWRGEGPPYVKAGAAVRYRKVDVDAWLAENTVNPGRTS